MEVSLIYKERSKGRGNGGVTDGIEHVRLDIEIHYKNISELCEKLGIDSIAKCTHPFDGSINVTGSWTNEGAFEDGATYFLGTQSTFKRKFNSI